jgi:hypothetical protein
MPVEIPLSELLKEDPKTVDVLYMLQHATRGFSIKNGPELWAIFERTRPGVVTLSLPLAEEVAKLGIAYRQFFRVMQIHKKSLDIDYKEWLRFYHEAFARCVELDKVEKSK